jgi:hypothetical protein
MMLKNRAFLPTLLQTRRLDEGGCKMYALVMFVCYLDGGCSEMVVDILRDEPQCLVAMKEQNLRHAGCYPMEEFIDGFWLPASEYSDF